MKSEIKDSPYKPVLKKVIEFERESSDTVTIKLDWQIEHMPGQFVFCSIPGIGEAPISICSYSNKYVELNIREVGNVTKALSKIKKGQMLLVRGPYGKPYPMEYFHNDSIIIIGGGCGVAPLKGVMDYILCKRNEFKDVHLYLGFRTLDDLLFKKRIDDWKKSFNVHISFDKLDKEKIADAEKSCFGGSQGFITQLVDATVHDNFNKIVFICGPPIMISKCSEILLKKGFHEDQIYISAERLMYCGMGKCGRCMIHGRYTCIDGAVFRFDQLRDYKDD